MAGKEKAKRLWEGVRLMGLVVLYGGLPVMVLVAVVDRFTSLEIDLCGPLGIIFFVSIGIAFVGGGVMAAWQV